MRGTFLPAGVLLAALVLGGVTAAGDDAEPEPLAVRFAPGERGSAWAPRYSPKGTRVALAPCARPSEAGAEPLEGRLPLGPASRRGAGLLVVAARSAADRPYDRLVLDTDGDGSLANETVLEASPRTQRGSLWTSFEATVRVRHAEGEEPEPYPIGLWIVVESADAVPPLVRYSRRGFLDASVALDGGAWRVVLSDADNDAVYGKGDWWALLRADGTTPNDVKASREVGDFAWAGERAFRLELKGTRGRAGRLVPFDPGVTPEEDARARDPYWDDEHAERAAAPVAFRRDVEAALEEARAGSTPCFLDFETVWCGPCKTMDRWVYTARDVVAAAEGVVCVKVDADERKDLKQAYGVEGFPTGVLLGADGKEIARFQGYRGVRAVAAFLGRAHGGAGRDE